MKKISLLTLAVLVFAVFSLQTASAQFHTGRPSASTRPMPNNLMDTNSTEIKIACIGGGSRYWARVLLTELALSPKLTGQLDLYDINPVAAKRNVAVAEALFARPEAKTHFKVRTVNRLADALRGADFVMISIEPGPMEMRFADVVIPSHYGILHPCGDSAGPAGTMRSSQ